MATTTLTRNLRLRINSNLTADARYNLERLDLLGGVFQTDITDAVLIRSRSSISVEPNSADIGGIGTGGTLNLGTTNHTLDSINFYALAINYTSAGIGLLDAATSGTKYLRLKYNSTVNGSVDTTADRTLSIDLDGADRSFALAGNLFLLGGSLTLNVTATSSVTLPVSGTLSTLAGSEVLINKSISGTTNTLSNIAYSSLILTNAIVNADISSSAAISGTKIDADFGNQPVSSTDRLRIFNSGGSIQNDLLTSASQLSSLSYTFPTTAPLAGQAMLSDASGNLYWDFASSSIAAQAANSVLAGPTAGPNAVPAFRALVAADIPSSIPATNISGGSVDNTEFGYLNGVTSAIQTQLDNKQPLDSTLTSFAAFNSNGLMTQTASDTFTARTITASSSKISVTNGNGATGNPTIDVNQGNIDHDSLLNFVTNNHIDHSSVQIATASGSGLSGGGTIAATRNLVVDITGTTAETAVSPSDEVLIYDVSASARRKATVSDLIADAGVFRDTWLNATGTTKTVTHNLGTRDVMVYIYDANSPFEALLVDTIAHTDTNTVTLTASSAPAVSWRVLVRKV